MTQPQIDWDKAWEVFWDRYERQAPKMNEVRYKAAVAFKKLWEHISPVMGSEDTIAISFDKDGELRTSMAGWVFIGAIARAGAIIAIDESKKMVDKELEKLTTNWKNKLQSIEDRLGPIEEYIGIKRPPLAEG